jgi:hypothetical protein
MSKSTDLRETIEFELEQLDSAARDSWSRAQKLVYGGLVDEIHGCAAEGVHAAILRPARAAALSWLLDDLGRIHRRRAELIKIARLIRQLFAVLFWTIAKRPPDIVSRQLPWFLTNGFHPPHLAMSHLVLLGR